MSSIINKCRCCGNDIRTDAFCNVCGMTPVSITDLEADLDAPAREYIRNMLGDGKVDVLCYTYSIENGRLLEQKEDYLTVCRLDAYWVGNVVYIDNSFEPMPTKSNFDVHLRISFGGKMINRKISVNPDMEVDRSKLGVEFMPCCRARLVVGGSSGTAYSEEFSLIAK